MLFSYPYTLRLLLVFFPLLPIVQLYAAPTLLLNNDDYAIDLKFYADILPDPRGTLTLADVTTDSAPFQTLPDTLKKWQPIDKGFTQSPPSSQRLTLLTHARSIQYGFF